MRALLLTEYRKLEITDLPRPTVGPSEVLVRVAACGICGSDVHGYDGSSGRRIPPIVMGHEAAGVVEEVGAAVDRAKVGDRVTFDSTIYCGQCDSCRRSAVNLCANRQVLGVSCPDYRRQGAFAEFVAVPQRVLYSLLPNMPFEHAAMIEPVSVAVHAVDRLQIQPGERAVVVGSGMIGLLVIQALRVAGCREVLAVDIDDARLELAKQLGATETINAQPAGGSGRPGGCGRAKGEPPARQPAVDVILALTNGDGVDVALEVVGNADALATAIGCVRCGGRVGLVGNLSAEAPFPLQAVVTREITLFGSCASAGEYGRAIELVANGQIRVAPLISAAAPLEEGPKWFERLYAREPGLMKVILKP
jgi:L-iditol 2-dehydrogenase